MDCHDDSENEGLYFQNILHGWMIKHFVALEKNVPLIVICRITSATAMGLGRLVWKSKIEVRDAVVFVSPRLAERCRFSTWTKPGRLHCQSV